MGTLQAELICRQNHFGIDDPFGLSFIFVEQIKQHGSVGHLEIIGGLLDFLLVVQIAVNQIIIPLQVVDVVDLLEIHRNAFETICEFHRYGFAFDTAAHLKIGKLGNFHAVQPYFPPQPGRSQSGRLPVILDKTDIMLEYINAERLEALQVKILDV